MYESNIHYDISHLSIFLQEIIKEFENYDAKSEWFNYDLKFLDLDINASINIMFEGIKMYMKEVVKICKLVKFCQLK